MEFSKFFNSSFKLNVILIISFAISVNSLILFPNINNAFQSSENIYLSPHIGAQTIEAQHKISQEIVSMIHEVVHHA